MAGINFVKLVAKLFADTSEFEKGLKSAARKSREFRQDVVKVFSTAAKYVAGLGAAFAFLVGKQSIAGDEIGKISQKYGVSAEALSTLDHAANLAGVSTEELAKSFKFMNSALVDAAGGSKEQIAAFATLGLSFKELSQLSPEDAFIKIGDAIAGIESPALKSALATKIFGKAGADLIPLFNLGAEGLRISAEEAERFGLKISNIDTTNLEAMNDSISKIGSATAGAARQFAVGLSPAISNFIEKMLSGVSVADAFRIAGEKIGLTFTFVANHLVGLGNLVQATVNTVSAGVWMIVKGFVAPIEFLINKTIEGLNKFKTEKISSVDFTSNVDAIINDQLNKSAKNMNESVLAYKESMDGLFELFQGKKSVDIAKVPKIKPVADIEDVLTAAKKVSEAMEEQKKKLEELKQKQQEWKDSTAQTFISIKDGFLQGGKFADNFKRTVLNVFNEIANNMIKLSLGAKGGDTGILGGISQSIFSGAKGFFGGLFKNFLPSFDVGSNYIPKDMTANIHKGEMIIPAREAAQIRSGGMSGGATVVQNITIGAGVSATVRQEVAKMLPDLKKAAIDGVKDARMRGNNI